MSDLQPQTTEASNKESNNIVLLVWLGTLFFSFVPSLIVYLVKKDDEHVTDQAKEALNWSIVSLIGYMIGAMTTVILIGFLIWPLVGIVHLVFCILGAINASNGVRGYRLPFNIRLIK
ncbi:hypothetical protein IGB42_04230 [Andreprevotia sp. IGB-42]|uniref:DUF4870 domain-containing protein n=1 Tax=Andreprevotia sp. IGB-42 TaxID=2497473 RepID=UPI001357B070|nr:DUF4870 domain-containing protein [Andreprevotia sp. IGB-42]KAF0811297.1 hypothetical protein IGB42_04230 [Andreprevotia sp. IGB-42]